MNAFPHFTRALRGITGGATVLSLSLFALAAPASAATLIASEDSYISQSSTGSNYGGLAYLQIKNNTDSFDRKIYLKLDLSGISNPITAASLAFSVSNSTGTDPGTLGGDREYQLFGMTDVSWTEGGITWSNAPANDASGSFTTPPATLFETESFASGAGTVSFSFGSSALTFLNNNLGDEVSFMLFRVTENASVDTFFSTESSFAGPTLTFTAVPEPSTAMLALGAVAAMGLARRRR